MAYLRLSNPTTDSCDFKVKLSNAFNRKYYKELRITGRDYGDSTSNVRTYVESRTARNSSDRYVEGVVNDGMSAGRKYTLHAYAQAKNNRWYKAGSDTIIMEKAGKADLRITSITTDSKLVAGQKARFKVTVENKGTAESSEYTVKVYDNNGHRLDYDSENELSSGDYNYAYLDVTMNNPGGQILKFYISGGESNDRTKYKAFTWNDNKFFDLSITAQPARGYTQPFERGENVTINAMVKNKESINSPKFKVKVTDVTYSKHTPVIATTEYYTVSANNTRTIPINLDIANIGGVGNRKLKFEIVPQSGYRNLNSRDDSRTYTYKWVNNIPDDFSTLIMQKAKAVLKDNPNLIGEITSRSRPSSSLINLLHTIRKMVVGITHSDSDKVVVGLVGEVGGSYIVGGATGAGVYLDGNGKVLTGGHASGGVIYSVPSGGGAIKLVVFPFAKSVDVIKGLGLTIGAGIQAYDLAITNLDIETVCISADVLSIESGVFKFKNLSASVQVGGLIDSYEFKYLNSNQQKQMIDIVNELDLHSL